MTTPMQPDLKAFIVFDRPPAGCIPFVVNNDDTAPLLRLGDIALVDTTDRDLAPDLFAVRSLDGSVALRELWPMSVDFHLNGTVEPGRGWFLAAYNRPRSEAEWRAAFDRGSRISGGFADGPYSETGRSASALSARIVGRVIGILQTIEPILLDARTTERHA